MKKLLPLGLLAMLSVVLFGCPYESSVPLSKTGMPVDHRFIGKWISDDETYNKYTVELKNESEYKITQRSLTGNTAHFTGYLTDVKGATFMNLYSDSTKTYFLYRVKIEPNANRLTLMPISEKLDEHFGSSDALRNYVEKHLNLQSFYNDADKEEFYKSE